MIFGRRDDSRASVEAAFEEARSLGHDSLGDEDLLLGILRVRDGIGFRALSSFGVTLEDAREECEAMLSDALAYVGISFQEIRREAGEAFDMRLPEKRRIPLSPRAKETLVRARREMRDSGDYHLGDEHILLGVLGDEDGNAGRLLARLGVSAGDLRTEILTLRDGEPD